MARWGVCGLMNSCRKIINARHLPCSLYHLSTTQPVTSVLPSSWSVKQPSLLFTEQLSDVLAPTLRAKLTKRYKISAAPFPSYRCGFLPWHRNLQALGWQCSWFAADGEVKGGGESQASRDLPMCFQTFLSEGSLNLQALNQFRIALTIPRG